MSMYHLVTVKRKNAVYNENTCTLLYLNCAMFRYVLYATVTSPIMQGNRNSGKKEIAWENICLLSTLTVLQNNQVGPIQVN